MRYIISATVSGTAEVSASVASAEEALKEARRLSEGGYRKVTIIAESGGSYDLQTFEDIVRGVQDLSS